MTDPARDVADSQHADSEGAVRAAEAKTAQGPRRPPSPKCGICGHPRADHSPQHAPGFSPGICHDCTYESGMRTHEFLAVLRWGETVGTDASRAGAEVGVPVCDDDGREIGEMRMGYANAGVLGAMLTDASEGEPESSDPEDPVVDWIKANIGDLPEWQMQWLVHAVSVQARERRRAAYHANAAFQHTMQIASGRDVPPLPATGLPTRVDDLTSDTYDALRARYAWLEQRYRDTVDSEQGAMVVRQAKEIGDRDAAIRRVRELHQRDSDDKCELCRYFDTTNWGGLRTHWPCDTIRALDGDTPKETT